MAEPHRPFELLRSEDFEEALLLLGELAESLSRRSRKRAAMALAAKALHFAMQEEVDIRFKEFVSKIDSPLTEEQKSHLRRMGFESD
jgi:hypothetical protein